MIKLYDYYRSSSSYRVRIALELKGLDYDIHHIDVLAGAHKTPEFKALNPQALVPTMVDGDVTLSQSLAIIEYLDEAYSDIPVIYGSAAQRGYIRQLAGIIACEVAPLNIPKVWKGYMGQSPDEAHDWMAHWMGEGFGAYEALLDGKTKFSCGDTPSLADICLMPQLYNARRFNIALEGYPKICAVEKACLELESFQRAAPESQPNAPKDLPPIHGARSPLLANAA